VQGVRLVRRAQALLELDSGDVALATAVCELDDVLAVVLVEPLAELAPEWNPVVTVDRGVVRDDEAASGNADPR